MAFFSYRVPCALLLLLMAVTVLAVPVCAAGDDAEKPWIVIRKADKRVLPKQDNVGDIEKGLAEPNRTAAKSPAKKPAENDAETAAKKAAKKAPAPKPEQKAAAVAKEPTKMAGLVGTPVVSMGAREIVITLPTSAMVTDTRYLNLDSPRRVALDVMGAWNYSGTREFAYATGAASKMAVGKHPDFLRLVLHLTRAEVPSEIIPRFQLVEGGLKITVPLSK